MALNGDALGMAIKAATDAISDPRDRDEIFKALGNAIVNYLVANAAVVVTSVGGVTMGTGVSGPGTGTLT